MRGLEHLGLLMKPASIHELGAHDKMTPEEALAYAARQPWEKVLILGYRKDRDGLITNSSHMTRECALWIIKQAEQYVLGEEST